MTEPDLAGHKRKRSQPIDNYIKETSREISGSQAEKICAECRKIDFESIFHAHKLSSTGRSSYAIGTLDHLPPGSNSSCPVCTFLGSMVIDKRSEKRKRSETDYQLYVYSAAKSLLSIPKQILPLGDIPLLTVVPKPGGVTSLDQANSPQNFFSIIPKNYVAPSDHISVRVLDAKINWTIPEKWLTECISHHTKGCEQDGKIPGLRVIDCRRGEPRQVVVLPRPSEPYVALSYVWGDQSATQRSNENDIIQPLPLIEDAIIAVQALGFEYLWVDQYCIPQSDDSEKHRLIQDMGNVYRNSVLTLIAASGNSVRDSLPGVNRRQRFNNDLQLSSVSLVPLEIDGTSVDYSGWSKRAWTYQESVFAPRKLYFTSQGLFFQCQSLTCSERLRYPPSFMAHISNQIELPNLLPINLEDSFSLDDFDQHVTSYHNRRLSFETDAINAFQGVLKQFRVIAGLRHLWGVPISDISGTHMSTKSLLLGLTWFCQSASGSKRRHGFPSWSWAGWRPHHCSGFRCLEDRPLHTAIVPTDVEISVQFGESGTPFTWAEHRETILQRAETHLDPLHQSLGRESLSPRLLLRAVIFDLKAGSMRAMENAKDPHLYKFDLNGRKTDWQYVGYFYMNEKIRHHTWPRSNRVKLAFLRKQMNPEHPEEKVSRVFLVIKENCTDGFYERIGVAVCYDPEDNLPRMTEERVRTITLL